MRTFRIEFASPAILFVDSNEFWVGRPPCLQTLFYKFCILLAVELSLSFNFVRISQTPCIPASFHLCGMLLMGFCGNGDMLSWIFIIPNHGQLSGYRLSCGGVFFSTLRICFLPFARLGF